MVANPTFYKKTGDPIWHLSGAFEHNFGPCGISKGRCVAPEVGLGGGFVEGWRFELGPLKTGFTKMSSRILHTYPCSVLAKDMFCDELHR